MTLRSKDSRDVVWFVVNDKGRYHSQMGPQTLLIENEAQLDERVDQMRASAARLQAWCGAFGGDGVEFLRALKFDQVGCHPLEDQ